MNPRYQGPEVLPPAPAVRKRVEEHLESLPGWKREPRNASVPPPRPEQPRKPGRPG